MAASAGCVKSDVPREAARDFSLLDQHGKAHSLRRRSARAVLIISYGVSCPIARRGLPVLRGLAEEHSGKLDVLLLDANVQDGRAELAEHARDFDIPFPIMRDETQQVSRDLGFTRTGEALLIETRGWRPLWRGPVDDRQSYEGVAGGQGSTLLEEAVRAFMSGGRVPPSADAPGCLISYRPRRVPDYVREVAPLVARACLSCHRGSAFGDFRGHARLAGWSAMIRETLMTARMPPTDFDPAYGRFPSIQSLSAEESALLIDWIDAGSPRGDGPDPLSDVRIPKRPDFVSDVTLTALGEIVVPSTGTGFIRIAEYGPPPDQDLWVTAMAAFNGGVSFTQAHLYAPRDSDNVPTEEMLLFDEPIFNIGRVDQTIRTAPPGTAFLIPRGKRLFAETHFEPTGRLERVRPSIGLSLWRGKERPTPIHVGRIQAPTGSFVVPAGDSDFELRFSSAFVDKSILIHALRPHMHYLGRRIRFDDVAPDGSRRTLLSVPRFRNKSDTYPMEPAYRLRRGHRIELTAAYDNSPTNPLAHRPPVPVRAGRSRADEMLLGWVFYTLE